MDTIVNGVMNATVGQIVGVVTAVVAGITVFVEFSKKIKKFPITSILNWIGERTNKALSDRMDKLEATMAEIAERQNALEEEIAEREAINCRVRIVRFADEISRQEKHSYESFEQVMSDIDTYETFCEEHEHFENNKTVAAKKLIKATYDECLASNTFL